MIEKRRSTRSRTPRKVRSDAPTLTTRTPSSTRALGARLGHFLVPGDVVGLVGDLGSGKTTFAQGIAQGLGVPKTARVRSPTFAVAHSYEGGPVTLHHLDFYRLESRAALLSLGYDDYLDADAVCVIEWLDAIPNAAPPIYLRVDIAVPSSDTRAFRFTGYGERPKTIADAMSGAAPTPRSQRKRPTSR